MLPSKHNTEMVSIPHGLGPKMPSKHWRDGKLGLCRDDEVQLFLEWNSDKLFQTCNSQIFI